LCARYADFASACASSTARFAESPSKVRGKKIDVQVWLSAFGVSQEQIEKFEIEWPPHLQDVLT